jgi:hypothetical protein
MTTVEETEKRLPSREYQLSTSFKKVPALPQGYSGTAGQSPECPIPTVDWEKRPEISHSYAWAGMLTGAGNSACACHRGPSGVLGKSLKLQGSCWFQLCFDLADYIASCFAVTGENAFIERIFSVVTYMKDKYSN